MSKTGHEGQAGATGEPGHYVDRIVSARNTKVEVLAEAIEALTMQVAHEAITRRENRKPGGQMMACGATARSELRDALRDYLQPLLHDVNVTRSRTEAFDPWLTSKEVAGRCGISHEYLMRMVRTGHGPKGCAGTGKLRRWRASSIDRWVEGGMRLEDQEEVAT